MRTQSYDAKTLAGVLRGRKVATLPELKQALGTEVDMTVFRKLRELGYRTSYSHRGKYYALEADMDFDARGLWTFGAARFSKHGTLLETACVFVGESNGGLFREELEDALGVGLKEALLKLFRQERVSRERHGARYLYCSAKPSVRRRQLMARGMAGGGAQTGLTHGAAAVPDDLKAAIVLFTSVLDEKQRRLFVGLESLKAGRGGDRRIAELTGMDIHTVARGRRELLGGDIDTGRVRAAGGGRKRVEKKRLE